ncbi:unnamed protein product [Rhizophagus irregularis]|uniref:Uncharacterized protein n=1 Tax=Rhizophagus irregularis TaxID=588596 RepID=A0A2I1FUC1_9GLOM|nr:hypothetical protein RhiirA4_500095 [Rhizophagus irregularis]CAB4424837.1 unnamed protein product [Rhizophagus irregularis]CAB4425216.1 unnamed protein product [Rhizophagus irregularis]
MFGLINISSRVFKNSKISKISIISSYIIKKSKLSSYHVALYSTTSTSTSSPFKQQKEPLDEDQDQLTDQKDQKPILALPEHSEESVKESENDDVKKRGLDNSYKLRNLGPVVVNEDGRINIINNWHEMTDLEREKVKKMILTRNRKRLEAFKKKEQE